MMAYAHPTPTSRGLTIHGSLVDTSQFSNGPSTGPTSGLSISQPDITEISAPSPTVYQSSPLRARSPASIAGIPLLSPLTNSKSAASGGLVKAAEIKPVLEMKLAYLSGGRDREGRTIVTIPALQKGSERPREELANTLYYLVNTVSEEVRENGFCIVVDSRGYSWQTVKQTLRMLQDCLPSQIHVVYIIQQGQFWHRRQSSFSRHSREKSRFEFSTITLSSMEKLLRHIEESQLTSDLGGFLPYNHKEWITFRLNLEQFMGEVDGLLETMALLEQHITKEYTAEDVEGAEKVLQQHCSMEEELKMCPQEVLKAGRDLISSIEQKPDCSGTSSITPDKINAAATIRHLLDGIQRRQRQLEELWRNHKSQHEQNLQLKIFERSVYKVKSWLKGRGMEALSNKQDIGDSVAAAEVLWQQHESLEAKAQNIYDNLTQLRLMVDKLCGTKHFASADMRQCIAKLSNRYTFFDARLQERSDILRLSMTLHEHMEQWRLKCEQCREEVMAEGLSLDDNTEIQDSLMDELRQSGELLMQEGHGLLEMMHQQAELQMPHPPDYKKSARYIRNCLDEVEDKQKRVEQLAEARKVRLDQFKQVYTCEKDAKQALQDLEHLLRQLSSCLGDLGNSLATTTKLRDEHTKITRAAKKTHEYGRDLLSAASKGRQACGMPQKPNQALLELLSATWNNVVSRGNQHTNWLDMLMTFFTGQREVQQQLSWLQQQSSGKLPELDKAESSLATIKETGPSTKQTAADTLDLGSDLLDELEQAKHFPTRDAACRSMRQQLEKLSALTKQHATLLDDSEKKLKDCIELRQLEQQTNEVIQWMQQSGQPHLLPSLGKDLRTCEEQLSQLEAHNEAIEEYSRKADELLKSVSTVEYNQYGEQLQQIDHKIEHQWKTFCKRWEQREQRLLAAIQYYTTINHLQQQFELFEGHMRLADLPEEADEIELHLEKTQGDRKDLLNTFRQALEDGRALTEKLIHGEQEDVDLPAAEQINEELDQLDKQRIKLDELWIKTQKYLNQTLEFQQKQQLHVSSLSPSEWLGSVAEPFISSMSVGTTSSEADEVIAKLDIYVKQAEDYQKQLGQNRGHVKDALQRAKEELQGRRGLLLHLRLLYSNVERCQRKLDALKDKQDPSLKEKAMHSVNEILKEGSILISQLEHFPLSSVRQVEMVCDRLKEKAGLSKRGSFSADQSQHSGSSKTMSKTDIIKQLEAFESASESFLVQHTELGDTAATAQALLKQYQQFQNATEPMIKELEKAWQHRSKGEADLKDVYERFRHSTQSCRQVVTKRLTIITSLVEYHQQWQMLQDSMREIDEQLQEPFKHSCTQLDARNQLENSRPVLQELHSSHDQCRGYGKQFLEMALSESESSDNSHDHISSLKMTLAAARIKQQLDEGDQRVQRLNQQWEEREHLLSHCIQGHALQMDCKKVSGELQKMLDSLEEVDLGDSLETSEQLSEEHQQALQRLKELEQEVEELQEDADDMTEDNHYNASSLTEATLSLRSLYKQTQKKMNERQQLLEACGNFFARSVELMQDFDTVMREKVCRPAKLEGFSSRLSALCSEGTSLIAMARASVSRGPRSEKVSSQGVDDTIANLQHKMQCYRKLDKRASAYFTSTSSNSTSKNISKRFSMGNFDDYSVMPKLELTPNPLPAASRLFPEKKREGLRRAGSMRVERSSPVQKLSSKFERSSADDTCKPTPPERVDSFKYLKNKRKATVNSLRQKFEQLSIDQTTPTSSMEDLSAIQPASGPTPVKSTELSGKDSPGRAKRTVPPVERANTLPPLGSPKASPPTKRFNILKQASTDRSESPKVSPQAIEAILESLSLPDSTDGNSKSVGTVAAGNRLSQHLHEQLPQLEESSDEEISKEMESLSTAAGDDEPDYGKEKLKSLGAITSELITGEAQYLQSLQCIVDGYIPAWDRPYLAAFLVGKKEIIFSNLTDIYHFQRQFYEDLLNCKAVQEVCKCFKTHEEGFSLYLVYLKALPQGKKVLSEFGGDFFEMIRKEKRYSRSFITNYLHPSDRLNQYISNFREMINAAQKEELHSVNVIRDTLKIFLRIDRIAAFTCITENPETLDEKECLLMDDFMVYTVKKKKKRAEEMRVFLHNNCVIFTKTTTSTEESSLSNHRVFEYLSSIKVNTLKLSETVEKGKHLEKFGLAEDKAGPEREYILQPVSKSVEVKQEWCTEVKELLQQQLEKIKQTKAHDSGSKLTETLPPPMTHVVELPSRFHKHKKTVKRDSDGGRGSVAARGSKHDSKHESTQLTNVRNSEDIRHISIELPQPVLPRASTGPAGPDRTILYETTEPYDGSGKDDYLTLDKGCQVEVLDKSGSDWLVCTVAETCAGVEKEGMLPQHILTPVTRQSSRGISKQVSTASSVSKRYSHISVRSNFSDQSTTLSTTTGPPYLDEDLYVIVQPPKISTAGKVSRPMIPSASPPSQQQYVYYAIKDYHPTKEGYVRLIAGESVEVLDKSNPKEWVISTIDNEERPSEEGLVPAEVLSAEYIPVRYESFQGEYSGSDEGRSSGEPPPIPPHHPSHDNDAIQPTTGSDDMNEKETGVSSNSPLTENPQETENPPGTEISPQADTRLESSSDKEKSCSPKPDTESARAGSVTTEETHDEDETAEDASSEQSDTTPVVSPRGSLHSGSTQSSPMVEKRDVSPAHIHNRSYQLSKSLTAVELTVPSIRIGSKMSHYGSDPALQELAPLSDSSPGLSLHNLAASEAGKSPMHERVSSILRESLLSSARNRVHSISDYLGGPPSSLDRKRAHPSSVASPIASSMVAELKDILGRSRSCDAGTGTRNKMAGHHDDRSSSISPEDALSEMKKLQQESVEQSSDSNKMEEYDQIEIYVAIADYVPEEEESNIPLYSGQHVQVLDCSREDWWLVIPMATTKEESSNEPLKEGWVPANHLEKLISAGSHDPSSHDPSSHDTEQLRELYNCSFLVDDPSPTQLEGMFSIAHPYMAKEAIQGTMPGQLSLYINQVVQVLDSKPDDWWLVATMATDKVPSIKGWVPASSLVAKSNDEALSPNREQPPVWYVRATFQSEDEGMLSIQEGELIVVVDSSSEEWYYAKTVQRDPPCEGWVPASYIYQLESTEGFDIPTDFVEALDSPWLRSAHQNSQSESSSEFDDDETQLLHEHLVSPDIVDGLDGEDRRQVAHEKRAYVIGELIESEKDYVEKLRYCIENYVTAVISSGAPKTLYGMKDILFCNMEAIHDFHRSTFLPQLEQCGNDHLAVANCFVSHADKLEMYVNYCTYQAKSDSVLKEYCGFFADLCAQLKDRWQLADYLILPVQRITKYSLLLEHILKYCIRAGEDCDEIDAALDITRGVSLRANNAIHLSMLDIDERKQKSYGTFIMQEKFDLLERVEGGRTRVKDRRLFLFEHVLVLSKKRRDDSADQETYFIKETLKLNELSATQDKDNAGLGLILYEMHSGNKYTLRAPSVSIRDGWYSQLHKLISANKMKKDTLKRTISEPNEPMGRSPSIPRKSVFGVRREPAKKSKLEGMPSNPSSVVATDDTEAKPGTQFLVLERIVMEGGDDLQLEPGEVVELVRKENNSTLFVRTLETTDAPAMEGNVPASFLRRKCVHKQSGLSEAMPKITKRPSNQTVSVGDTVTFSSIFNGFPAPSVTWRKASVTLTTSDRCKITVLSNSTLFELTDVKFSDAGVYACVVANSAGTDTATVELSVVGPPDAPTRLIVSKVATTSLKLKWMPPEFDGHSEITTYQVEQLQEGLNEWLPIVQQPKTLFMVKTLEPNTSYQFRIIAYNEYGPSQPSEPSQTVFTKSTNKGFLTAASPSFRKKMAPTISSNQSDSKGNDVTDFDFLSQQPPLMGNMLGLPSVNQSLSQPPMEDSVFSSTVGSPPPSYIRTTPITVSYDLTLEELGRGRYGIVQKCISKKTQEAVAAKYLRLRTKKRLEIRREAELHQRLLHPHIITFFDAYEAGRNLVIVMEIATGGELLDYIVQTKTLTEAIAVKYLSQVILALQYMHKLGVAHMDIRPENILLSSNQEPIVKLIDLGSARDLSLPVTHPSYGSPEFCAPEILNKETVNEAADMWGLGALTYVILSGVSPFFGDNPQITRFHIKEGRYDFNAAAFEQVSQDAKDFIHSLLQLHPQDRLSATACQEHPWIKTLNPKGTGVPSWPMAKLDLSRLKTFIARRKWHSSNIAVETNHVFGGRMASMINRNSLEPSDLQDGVPPSLSGGPDNLVVKAADTVSFCHQVQGTPTPSIQWEHNNKQLLHSARVKITNDGINVSLTILDVGRLDEGVYTCTALNSLGSMSAQTKLVVLDKPLPPSDLNSVSLGNNSALVSWSRPSHDGSSPITGYLLEHKRNDQDTWVLSADEIHSTAHVVDDLLPGNSYQFRVAAVNAIGCSQFSKPSGAVSVDSSPEEGEWDNMEAVKVKDTPFEQEYTFKDVISKGTFSVVRVCVENSTDRLYAAKVINLDGKQRSTQAFHEFNMLASLSHPRIVTIEGAFQAPTKFVLVMEYLSGGELLAHLAKKEMLNEEEYSHYIRQVLEGLHYIHSNNIIHMAIKPANIILTSNHRDIKLVDFRLARYIQAGNQLEAIEGNPEFLAPETVSLKPVTTAADIWSVGIITCIMLTGVSPFLAKDQTTTIACIQAARLDNVSTVLNEVSHDAKDFILNNVLKTNPRRRLTAAQLLRHRWLQANSRLKVSRSSSIQETSHLKQFVQHRKVSQE